MRKRRKKPRRGGSDRRRTELAVVLGEASALASAG
jgi:hypothetical protein